MFLNSNCLCPLDNLTYLKNVQDSAQIFHTISYVRAKTKENKSKLDDEKNAALSNLQFKQL